jgi:hypothetical protein
MGIEMSYAKLPATGRLGKGPDRSASRHAARSGLCYVVLVILTASASRAWAAPPIPEPPPPEIVKLEKTVSLELAHVRDSGPTEPARRKQLFEAHELDRQAEAAIRARDYKSAEDSLLKARVILRQFAE